MKKKNQIAYHSLGWYKKVCTFIEKL